MASALLVCTPGMEKELLAELREVWPYLLKPDATLLSQGFPEVQLIRGGVEVPCDFFTAVQFNFFLKVATRVLWRIHSFRCRDFPKLHQSLQKIPWKEWLSSPQVEFHVSAAGSRLNNEKRIEETARDFLKKISWNHKKSPPQGVYIRNFKDQITVSLDLSGEPLYKRISNKKTGEAPFRESWAHFVLRRMLIQAPLNEASAITLVDPFCGSGTFPLEAISFQNPNFTRAFSFQDLSKSPKLFRSPTFQMNYKWPLFSVFKEIWGCDQDPKMISLCQHNESSYQQSLGRLKPIRWEVQKAEEPKFRPEGPLWLVANPPWGTRLSKTQSFESLVSGLAQAWRPQKMALVLPEQSLNPLCISTDYKLHEKLSLNLGGQAVDLWVFDCKKVSQ